MALILAGMSALLYGIADFSGGFSSRKSPTLLVLAISQGAGVLLALVALFIFWPGLPAPADLAWGVMAGLCGALGLFMLYRGIATSIVAVVSPSSALVGALLPLAFGLALGERPSSLALVGALLCLPAVLLLSMGSGGAEGKSLRSALIQGCIAGIGFGGFFIAISRAGKASGLWPVVISRSTSLTLVGACLLAGRKKPKLAKGSLGVTLAAGLSDMGANIFFLFASRSGLLSLVSVVSSLYPAPTVLLGRVVLHERIPPARLAGIILAIAGVVLISLK
jgi:drug/metabolite transporter (DMT)-like permease